METKARGRKSGSKNYSREFREAVVAQANDPSRSIAEVAQEHGLNANMIARWRRIYQQRELPAPTLAPIADAFLPVQISAETKQPSVIAVEGGGVRVRFEGPLDLGVLQTVLACLRASS
jgi:transposase